MHSAKVITNLVCNQGCRHCTSRAPSDARAFVASAATNARIDAAIAHGAREIWLTGGEPTMRRDLSDLIAHARTRDVEVGLETNATLVTDDAARRLAESGLAVARVNLAMWGDALDELTRDPGGFARTRAGLRALAAAGVPLEIAVTLLRSTVASVADLPAALVMEVGAPAVRSIVVSVPVEAADPALLLAYEEVVPPLLALEAACRRAGIRLRMAAEAGPPPCVFPHQNRVAHLYTMTPGAAPRAELMHLEACSACVARDRCIGISRAYVARRGEPSLSPVADDRVRRRLSIAKSVDDQIRHELVSTSFSRDETGKAREERIVRVNFRCNQVCGFCFVSTHLPGAGDAALRAAIEDAARAGCRVVLSGGEPTLNPSLVDYVRLAKRLGKAGVELQTNATLLDDPARVAALVDAGLDSAFVSLHAATAEVSDGITGAPGTFVRTIAGIDNLVAAKIQVVVNFVMCHANMGHLPRVARMIGERWAEARLCVSFVAASTDVVPLTVDLMPRYSEVVPDLVDALDEAEAAGVQVVGFEGMCGIPLCVVPASKQKFFTLDPIAEGSDEGEFLKAEACRRCALADRCFGVRRRYAALHGTSELTPVAPVAEAS